MQKGAGEIYPIPDHLLASDAPRLCPASSVYFCLWLLLESCWVLDPQEILLLPTWQVQPEYSGSALDNPAEDLE
jgi:hypothetical protein